MVRLNRILLKEAGIGINKTLSEILVCPLSKQPLRYCEETNSLISDALGVSFPLKNSEVAYKLKYLISQGIKDGIPCLNPRDGKVLETDDTDPNSGTGSSSTNKE